MGANRRLLWIRICTGGVCLYPMRGENAEMVCHIHDECHGGRRAGSTQPIEPDGISLQKANTKRPHDQQLAFGGTGGGDPEGP